MLGFPDVAREVEEGWAQVARTVGITEDYHGYYAQSFSDAVAQTLEAMLTLANPYRWTKMRQHEEGESDNTPAIVSLLNQAWEKYQTDPEGFRAWEVEAVRRLLS